MGDELALALALEGRVEAARPEAKALVALAQTLASLPEPEIDARFAAALEERLLTDGLETAPARPRLTLVRAPAPTPVEPVRRAPVVRLPRRRFVVRRSLAAMTAAAALAAFPMVAAASALPGSPFWGLRQMERRIEVALARGPVADGFTYMKFAREDASAAAQLAAFPRPDQGLIASVLGEVASYQKTGGSLVLEHTKDPATLNRLADIARATASEIAGMGGRLAPEARSALEAALRASEAIQQAVARALGLPLTSEIFGAVESGMSQADGPAAAAQQSGTSATPEQQASTPAPGGGSPDQQTKKYVKDAADSGCRTIGGAQLGNTGKKVTDQTCGLVQATI